MIIVMQPGATDEQVQHVKERVEAEGLQTHISRGDELTIIGCIGDEAKVEKLNWRSTPGVQRAERITNPWKMASRQMHPDPTVIDVDGVKVGGGTLTIMAGPCTVEGREMLMGTAKAVKDAGGHILRGGAFKPRTSPYDFQGLGVEGLKLLHEATEATGLPTVTEVRSPTHVPLACRHSSILQIGARNMQNYDLLRQVGQVQKPVLLKRGFSSTIKELLLAAEYILHAGNQDVMLCERGIRTFENATRFTFDVSAIPVLKELTHLPIIVDPSHAAGRASLIPAVARAGVAAGADGLIIEVHNDPGSARCDADQAITPESFSKLVKEMNQIHEIVKDSN